MEHYGTVGTSPQLASSVSSQQCRRKMHLLLHMINELPCLCKLCAKLKPSQFSLWQKAADSPVQADQRDQEEPVAWQ